MGGHVRTYPYRFYVALDGNGINGFEGMAGVCLLLFDPADNAYAYKVQYFDGAAAGHATSVNPGRTVGFLGNAGQHLLFYDAATLDEVDRISTLQFEINDTTLRGSTHLVWLDDTEFITAVGDYLYRFDLNRLGKGERLGPHLLKLPHAMKLTASGRYIVYGGMDNPVTGEAREMGIYDLRTGEATRVELPATCWHLTVHPTEELAYPVSFRVVPQEGRDYKDWAIGFSKEYAFEIDVESGQVLRHWAVGRDSPAHLNSDVTISDRELIFCNGASQSIVFIDLASFSQWRMIDEHPGVRGQAKVARQVGNQAYDSLARGSMFTSSHHFLSALRASRFTVLDSIYATMLSRDQSLLFTANRGMNHITIYDYPSNARRLRVELPDLHEYVPSLSRLADPRLGLHHSYLASP
jgi:hypothetical protein